MRAALWIRVSNADQTTENQRAALESIAATRSDEITAVYDVTASAWAGNHVNAWAALVRAARRGEFERVYVWALDRVSREGPSAALAALNSLYSVNVEVVSAQESWLEQAGPMRELLISMFAWVASYESERRSERVKAALDRRRAAGLPVGRPPGAKDKAQRRRSKYVARYET